MMVGSALVDVCRSIIFGLTRGDAEHYNPNDTEFDRETFGFLPLERTGLEWVISPDEELIFQETVRKKSVEVLPIFLMTMFLQDLLTPARQMTNFKRMGQTRTKELIESWSGNNLRFGIQCILDS